jgi:hypothetical protein
MEAVRQAASFEGLIILAVIYFVLNLLSRAGKRAGQSDQPPAEAPDEPAPTQQEALSLEKILQEIERVKKEKAAERRVPPAERAKPLPPRRPPPPPLRRPEVEARQGRMASPRRLPPPATPGGPMGRPGSRKLQSHEEVEERESLEGASLEVEESLEVLDDTRFRPLSTLDHDDEAEAVVQARIKAAEQRNRAHTAKDHREFHDQLAQDEIGAAPAAAKAATAAQARAANLRKALIWREILGPPKGLEDWGEGLRD